MKKFFIGFIVGVVVIFAFIVLGGGEYVRTLGSRTEDAGTTLERFEKQVKKSTRGAKKTLDKTADRVKQYIP